MKRGTLRTAGATAAIALVVGVVAAPRLPALLPDVIGQPLARWLGGATDTTDILGTVVASVRAMNDLTVLEARMFSVAKTPRSGWVSALDTTTYVIVPGAVRYRIDLSRIDRSALNWDPQTATLIAVLPEPEPGEVNIDGAQARVIVDGLDLTSGDAREKVLQASLDAARTDMRRQARQAYFRDTARAAARTALAQNLAAPLRAAGLKPVVIVRFRGEAAISAQARQER